MVHKIDYEGSSPRHHSLNSPRAESTRAVMADTKDRRRSRSRSQKRRPMKPRHDEPQENMRHQSRSASRPKRKNSSSSRKTATREIDYDYMDEDSREAHIVQKIEMAIKKSKSERRAQTKSQSNKKASNKDDPPTDYPEQKKWYKNNNNEEEEDENTQLTNDYTLPEESPARTRPSRHSSSKSKQQRRQSISEEASPTRTKPSRHSSSKSKQQRRQSIKSEKSEQKLDASIPLTKKKSNKYKRTLIDLDETMDNLDLLDGMVDDKKGLQVSLEEQWLKMSFSDPTIDTFDQNNFLGKFHQNSKQQLQNMLDPQRIGCGPGRSATGTTTTGLTGGASIMTGRDNTDPVVDIIQRINEKKGHHNKTGRQETSYTSRGAQLQREHKKESSKRNDRSSSRGRLNQIVNKDERLNASELISFDHYEDDDGHYYEDDDDSNIPIYPSSTKAVLPQRPLAPSSMLPEPALVEKFDSLMDPYKKKDSGMQFNMQGQLDEINRLQQDIQRQQELIKEANRYAQRENNSKKNAPNPHETSAEAYQRELARQAQAELYLVELEQKSMMLEKQLEIYKRNQEEWNKVRKLAIQEEESRKKNVEKARKRWHDELRGNYLEGRNNDDNDTDYSGIRELSDSFDINNSEEPPPGKDTDSNKQHANSHSGKTKASKNDNSSRSSGLASQEPSLYEKVAELNKRAEMSEDDQKHIEMEILKELHMELSKQAAEKKIMQKPLFFSEKLRSSWSGKQPHWMNDPNIPVEYVTEELSRQIQQLGLEAAPSRYSSSRSRKEESRRHSEGSKRRGGLPLVKSQKNKDQGESNTPPRIPEYAAVQEPQMNCRRTDSIPYDDDSNVYSRISGFTSEPDSQPPPPREADHAEDRFKAPKKRRSLLKKLGFRKNKDKGPKLYNANNKIREVHGLIMSTPGADYRQNRPENQLSPINSEDVEEEDSSSESGTELPPTSSKDSSQSEGEQACASRTAEEQSNASTSAPKATDSQSTQRTSNKVYIGVNENAIETMSFTPRHRQVMSFAARNKDEETMSSQSSSIDKYASLAGGNAKVTPGRNPMTTRKEEDDPSLFEYLEVQYFPHDVDDEEAPDDELEADVQTSTIGQYYPR